MKYPIIAWADTADTVTIHWNELHSFAINKAEAKQLWEMLSGVFLPPNVVMRTISTPEEVEAWRTELRSKHSGYPLIRERPMTSEECERYQDVIRSTKRDEDPEPVGGITSPSFIANEYGGVTPMTEAQVMNALDAAYPDGLPALETTFTFGDDGIVYREEQPVGTWASGSDGPLITFPEATS